MPNMLNDGGSQLVDVDYSDLLTKILNTLKTQENSLFTITTEGGGKRLSINIDEIANLVASQSIEHPLGGNANRAKAATVNFSKDVGDNFIKRVREIRDCLKDGLESSIRKAGSGETIEDYIRDIALSLSNFDTNSNSSAIGLEYPFTKTKPTLKKQKLSLDRQKSNSINPLLRAHKVTIIVKDANEFSGRLKAGIENFIDVEFAENEKDELNEILKDNIETPKSDFDNIQKLMQEEALGKIQREATVRYLEYLQEQIGDREGVIYLTDLIRRLRILEQFINDEDKDDGYYDVNYGGYSFNYRTMFSRSDAYKELPIIPIIDGCLGEINDKAKGEQQFVFGIKLKLNGRVNIDNDQPAFEYHLNKLNINSSENQEKIKDPYQRELFIRKALKICLLYYFVFACKPTNETDCYSDLHYNPRTMFEGTVLPILNNSNDRKKEAILSKIAVGLTSDNYQISQKIERLKKLLVNKIQEKSLLKDRKYPFHLRLNRGILVNDLRTIDRRSSFFKESISDRQALKYISVEDAEADNNALCTLSGEIKINDLQYFDTIDSEDFQMEYDLSIKIPTIPVIVSSKEDSCQRIYNGGQFKKHNVVCFLYNRERLLGNHFCHLNSSTIFSYKFTFSLLAYIASKILFESNNNPLFIAILRLQVTGKENTSPEEEFFRSLFSTISHLLNEKNRCSSQGLNVTNSNEFKIKNALSSLYSTLPKKFIYRDIVKLDRSTSLKKLAIIIVSSRVSDLQKKGDDRIINLVGEAIGIEWQKDGVVRIQNKGTFSGNYESKDIYTHPDCPIDKFAELYKFDFRHFLYIAKSPYSQKLNVTNTEEDEKLFFMSKQIIKAIREGKPDLKIYPIFFDRYSALKIGSPQINSLYIQDPSELAEILKDPNKKSIVFFNLFNGITVGNSNADRYYNGVMSYSTLLNIYENILEDSDIHEGLIQDGNLKRDILHYLTLFHFSRYESLKKEISLKLDPYEGIIGDKSVGKISIFKHAQSSVDFNLLAFLTEVRKSLNV